MADTYELIVESESRIIRKVDEVTEVYSLLAEPKPEYSLVKESEHSILQTIQLDELFSNLDNCVSLLDITYNAVNGMTLHSGEEDVGMSAEVTSLKDKFSNTLDESLTVMTGFETGTKAAIQDFIAAYKYLTNPLYKAGKKNGILKAVEKLSGIEKKAVRMEKEASSLAATFDEIESAAQTITNQIMNERDLDVKKKDEAIARLNALQGKAAALKEVKEDLDSEVDDYSNQYSKLSRQIEKNEERAYTLSLVSAIMGGLSSMFGGGTIPSQPEGSKSSVSGETSSGKSGETQKRYEESEKKVQELKNKIEEYDKELAEIKEQLKEETDEEKKKELSDKQDQLTKDKSQAEKEMAAAREQSGVYKNVLSGISEGLGKTSEKLDQMAEKLDDNNQSQYDRLDKIAQQKARVQKERRETVMQMAEMASEIENATTESRDLELCISALITAVGSMRIVKVYLSDIALFWKNVAKFCGILVERVKSLNDDIENFAEVEDYCEIFKEEEFVNAFLLNMVSWAALHNVSKKYLDAFYNTRAKYQELEKVGEAEPKEHWMRAKESAKALNSKLAKEVEQCSQNF